MDEQLWNQVDSLRRLGGDAPLLCSMIDFFLEDAPVLLNELEQLIEDGNPHEAARQSHSLKGLCANFDAAAASQVARDTEAACLNSDFDQARVLLAPLKMEIHRLTPQLESWRNERRV